MYSIALVSFFSFFFLNVLSAQFYHDQFTKYDTLRGSLTEARTNYDVLSYDLDVKLIIERKQIRGSNNIMFEVIKELDSLQIDLFSNMYIDSIIFLNENILFRRDSNVTYVYFPWKLLKGTVNFIKVFYNGVPQEAKNPPWGGGFVWNKDKNGKPWVGVACEGVGASLWWPNKDHLSDEPDRFTIHLTVPSELMGVSNGRLVNKKRLKNGYTKYSWLVDNPINNYNITMNVADYELFKDVYVNVDGDSLSLDYYVFPYNLDTARAHFVQTKDMLECFEKLCGSYPFYKDGFKLVEASYWGMEHQSCIAYGNNFENNRWGFDYILIHESAHEWFGNSLSCTDHAEMWLHEAFATYMEALYMECKYGFERSVDYLRSQRIFINKEPLLGPMDVNFRYWISSDIYYKGSWMLHTLRNVIGDDALWFDIINIFTTKYKKSSVKTSDFTSIVSNESGRKLDYFFEQYLKKAKLPVFKYKLKRKKKNQLEFEYMWDAQAKGFRMPIKVTTEKDKYTMIFPDDKWKSMTLENLKMDEFKIAEHLYLIKTEQLK